ncbi:MAG: hypothetical protein KA758_06970 [Acidimicrobiales bacterium]|jgi:hypothetical protein|nr:hypothetical protein [Acidimicrobiales bacterium]
MGDWKYVTDDEWSDGDREAMASLLVPFRESGAGCVSATGLTDDDRPVKSYALAKVKGRDVGIVVDHRDGSLVWAHRSQR